MLRRPPTIINLTTEDLSIYEQERAARIARANSESNHHVMLASGVEKPKRPRPPTNVHASHQHPPASSACDTIPRSGRPTTALDSHSQSSGAVGQPQDDVDMDDLGEVTQPRPTNLSLSGSDFAEEATPGVSRETLLNAPRVARRNVRRSRQDHAAVATAAVTPTPSNGARRPNEVYTRQGPVAPSRHERITGSVQTPGPSGAGAASMR